MIASYLHQLTDFGDSAITCTFTVMAAAYLLSQKQKRAAAAIILAFCLTSFLITLGKAALYSRCTLSPDAFFDLRSPSGHSAISIAVYGTFAAIIASSQSGWRRIAPYLTVAMIIALIAFSRIALGYHTVTDVIVGSGVGIMVTGGVWYCLLKGQSIQCRWVLFTLLALVIVVTLNGVHFPAELIISHFSALIRSHMHNCG